MAFTFSCEEGKERKEALRACCTCAFKNLNLNIYHVNSKHTYVSLLQAFQIARCPSNTPSRWPPRSFPQTPWPLAETLVGFLFFAHLLSSESFTLLLASYPNIFTPLRLHVGIRCRSNFIFFKSVVNFLGLSYVFGYSLHFLLTYLSTFAKIKVPCLRRFYDKFDTM